MGLLWPPMRPPPLPPRASPCPHGKTVHASTNQAIPPPSPEHTGHCTRSRPSPTWENDPGKRARGLTVIPLAYSGRREALTPQYRASQSPVRACPESPETGSQASEHVASLWRGASKPETGSQTTAQRSDPAAHARLNPSNKRTISCMGPLTSTNLSRTDMSALKRLLTGPIESMQHEHARARAQSRRILKRCVHRRSRTSACTYR